MIRLRVLACAAMLCAALSAFGANFTSNGTGGGDWSSTATWGGAGVPAAGDNVTITGSDTVTVTDSRTCNSVQLDTTSGNKVLDVSGFGNLSITGTGNALLINAPTIGMNLVQIAGGGIGIPNGDIQITGGGSTVGRLDFATGGGTLTVKQMLFSGTSSNAQVTFSSGAGNVTISENLGSGGSITSGGSTFTFNGTGTQTINGYTFDNLTIAKTSGTATLNGAVLVNGNLTVSSGVFDDGGNQITLNAGGTSNVNIGSTGVLKLGAGAMTTSFPLNVNPSNIFFSPGSVVVYHSGLAQTINTSFTYRRLWLTTTGGNVTHSFTGTLNVAEDLTVNDNGVSTTTLSVGAETLDINTAINGDGDISVSSGFINLGGNWSSSVGLAAGATSTVTYDGNGAQSVAATTYGNLSITKTAGIATLAGNTIVTGNLGISGSGALVTNNNSLDISGSFGNSSTFDAGTSTVTFIGAITNTGTVNATNATFRLNGASPQLWSSNPGAITVNTLEINNGSGVTIGNNTSVTGSLILNGGKVTISGSFFIDVAATVTRTSGWFVGPLTMGFNTTPVRRMHVGTGAAYLPIDVDSGSAGTLTARANEGAHPNKTGTRVLARYWTIDSGSITPIDSLIFQYSLSDITTGNEVEFMLGTYSAGWTRKGDLVMEGVHTATITNVATYVGDWVVGHAGSMGGAGKLKFTSINGGSSPVVNVPFSVNLETRTDDDSTTGDVLNASSVDVLLAAGSGSLLTGNGTVSAGTHTATVSGLSYDTVESGVQLSAVWASTGDPLDSGTSNTFSVVNPPATLTVSSINDSGVGTLRDAIDTANLGGCGTPCTINFTTSGTIVLATPLSPITRDDLLIDGYSAPGAIPNTNGFGLPFDGTLTMQLDGSGTIATGFEIQGQNDVIKGFVIKNFTGKGVAFTGTNTNSAVEGCFIGTDASGNNAAPNGDGVGFTASSGGTVGGTSAAARNVISGNSWYGVYAGAGSTNIGMYGNYIGVRADLTGALANADGIQVTSGSSANIGMLGGPNLISGNTGKGIELDGSANVQANFIGTNGTGIAALPNGTGIFIGPGATGTTIGPAELNVISGNTGNGIEIQGDNNSVANAYVGIGSNGSTPVPNGGIGVRISGSATNNSIGVAGANKIAHNTGQGVSVATSSLLVGNPIRTNEIFSNGVQAIDLGEDGPTTPNDATDADGGANGLQNFPIISSAQISGSNVQLSVSVDSSGSPGGTAAFIIDVYKADASSPEQALEYLGNSGCLAGTVFSNYAFTVPQGTVVNGSKIVATATSYVAGCTAPTDGTSELSAAATVSGAIHWINASGGNWSTASNWNPAQVPTASDEVYIDAGGSYTVIVSTAEAAGILHVGTGISGTQTLAVTGTGSLALGSASDVTTTGAMSVVGGLSGAGLLSVNGVFNWDGGTLGGSTGLTINSGGLLTINNAVAHALSFGTLTVAAGATANWNAGSISLANNAHIDNFGLFESKTDNSISNGGVNTGFDNFGTLRKSTTSGTTTFNGVDLDHSAGTIDIQTGTLDVAAGSATAPITISSGATFLVNSDTFTLGAGATATGLGKIHITGGTLDVTGPAVSVEHLYLQGGTLTGTGNITGVTGNTWQWDGGTMSGTGTTIVPGGATLLAGTAGAKSLNTRTLQIQGSGTLNLGGTGALQLLNGGNINNAGIFDIIGDAPITDAGSAGSIVNSATFKKTGTVGGTTSLSNVTLTNTNTGTIQIQTGTLDPADLSNNGTITNNGTLLINSNTVTLGAGSSIGGAGLVQVTSGTLTVDAAVTFPNLQLDGGTINGTAVLNATALTWNGGTMSGTGTTNIPGSASATIATASAKSLQRSFNVAPTGIATLSGSGTINMGSGGNITNNGTFEITGDGGFNDSGSAGTIANTGTFRKSTSTNTTSLTNINFNHSGGTLDVQSGTFDLAGGTSSAPIAISGGATLLVNSNTYTFAAGTTVSGAGLVQVSGGTLSVTGNVAIPQFNLSAGTLDGNGTTTLTNTADWSGGVMQGGGMTTVDPSATLTISGASGKNLNNRTLSIVSGGTVTVSGSGTINLLTGGNISNAGLFHFTGDAALNDAGTAGAFANSGTLRKSTSTNTTVFSNVNLNHTGGTLDLQTGTFDLAGGTSSAPIAVASGATLLFNSNTYTLANGTTFSGTGMVSLQAGTLSVTGNVSIPIFGMTAGTLDGSGTLFLTSVADWSGGTMQGGGATTVTSPATLTISSPSAKALNNRTLSTIAGGTINITGVGTINFLNGGNVNNAGTFVTDVDSTLNDGGSGGGFANTGTFRKQTTTGPTTFTGVSFSNNGGLVDLQTGTLSTTSFTQTAGSTLKVRLGGTGATQFSKLNVTSSPSLAGTLDVTLAGLYQPVGGDVFQILTSPGGAHSGDFTQPYTYPALTGGRTFSDAYNASGLLLTVNGFADLSIGKTAASNNYPVSSPISYTITVTNNSADVANSVSVSDTLPGGHTGISASGTGWNCNVVSSTVTCNALSSLPNGAAPNITINATTPSTPQSFTNTAAVSSGNDSNGTNNSSGWPVTIDPNTVDIEVTSTSPSTPVAQSTGFTIDYIIKNNGPQTATNVVFSAPIVPDLTFSSATPDQGPPCTFLAGTVTCNLGTILSGNSPHVLLNLTTGTTPGTRYVTGNATQTESDSNFTNNTNSGAVLVSGTYLVVQNSADFGTGSLRQALLDAQNTSACPAPCTIQFNTNITTIQPASDLPPVPASAIVDGTTQPGYAGTPVIQLDGLVNPSIYLLTLSGGGSTVKGLSLTNAAKGLYINSNNNVVIDNYIGLTPGAASAGNAHGVVIDGSNNRIGGTTGGANTIAFNTNSGVNVVTGIGNEITGNSIHGNALLGIDLANDGATPNDANDADTGSNNLQNFPTLTAAFKDASNDLHISYNHDSSGAANIAGVLVEIYKADSVASGQGQTFLARTCFALDVFGGGTSFNAPSINVGDAIVLTATGYSDTGCTTVSDGTSEFSNLVTVASCVPPAAAINAPASACASSTGNAASVNAPTATQWTWTVTGGTLLTGQGTPNITFSAPASGSVGLTVLVRDGNGCPNTVSTSVPVVAQPNATITAPSSACASSTGNTASVAPGASSYVWTITNGTITAGQGTNAITFTAGATGSVSLGVTAANGSCSSNGSANVPIVVAPAVGISAPPSVCPSSTGNNASVAPGASSYVWSITNGTITGGAGTNAITFSAGLSGNVVLGVAVSNGTCTSNGSSNVPIVPLAVNITGTTIACPNQPFVLDAGAGFATYSWSTGETSRFITVTQSAATATYNVTVTSGSCNGNDSHTVSLGGTPDPNITTALSVDANSTNNVASVPSQPGASYSWSISNGVITGGDGTNSILFTAGASGVVNINVTVNVGGCNASSAAGVLINGAQPTCPSTPPSLLAPANNAVVTSPAAFSWSPVSGATSYELWINNALAASTTSTSITHAVPNGASSWFVIARLDGNCSALVSGTRTFSTQSETCPTASPSLVSPSSGAQLTNGSVTFLWNGIANAAGYDVYLAPLNGTPVLIGSTGAGTTSLVYDVPPGDLTWSVDARVDGCPPRSSQSATFNYTPPVACDDNPRPLLISPLDQTASTSPVSFDWNDVAGATRYEVYTIRGEGAPVLLGSSNTSSLANASLATGAIRWFVRAFYGQQCSSRDSEERALEIVSLPEACSPLASPVLSAPGEISSGVEFLLQWGAVPGATAYQVQIDNADAGTTSGTVFPLTRTNGGNTPLAVAARVRAVDTRCSPARLSDYSATTVIFVLPQQQSAVGNVPVSNPMPVHYTIALGAEFAGQSFIATPSEDWLSVSPASGTVGASGTTLNVTANPNGLDVGTHSGAVVVALNPSSSRLSTNGSTVSATVSVNLVTPVTPAPSTTPTPDTMIIPAVANADGINSHFQSDVRVANTSAKLIKYQLTFIPSGDAGSSAGRQTTFSIDPGQTVALDDVLKSWFGTGTSNAIGVLQIKPLTTTSSSIPVPNIGALSNLVSFASSRTFNVTPNGTFGQYIPAVPFANFADKSTILSLQQIAQSIKARTNLGLVEGSGNPADLLIRVFGGNGQQLTQFTQRLNGGQHTQLNSFLLERGITLEDGRVEVQVTSSTGKVTAYASVLDNETSDAVLVTPVPLTAQGNTKWVLPGVADIRSGFADWQSDVRIFNAGVTSTNVTASFYSQAGGEPKVQTITLGAGEVKQLDKILPTLFGVSNDAGALHLSTASASRIIATARTYNQTSKGTYGQFISAVTPQESVAVGTRPLQLLQVEESSRMRSNIGFAEVTGKPVKLEVTVIPPDAKFVGVIEVDLGPNEYRQIGSLLASLGLGDTYNTRISVRAISGQGRATTYASVIDLATNDPMYVLPQ